MSRIESRRESAHIKAARACKGSAHQFETQGAGDVQHARNDTLRSGQRNATQRNTSISSHFSLSLLVGG